MTLTSCEVIPTPSAQAGTAKLSRKILNPSFKKLILLRGIVTARQFSAFEPN